MWIVLSTVAARAQVPVPELDAQLFRPSLDSRYTLWTNDSSAQPSRTLMARVVTHYTKDPLTYRTVDDTAIRVISDVIQTDLAAAIQLGPVRVGADLPIVMYADGATSPSSSGFGDLAFDVKGTLVERDGHAGLGVLGRISMPTGALPGLSSGRTTASLEAIVDSDVSEDVFIAANLGYRAIPDAGLDNWRDGLYARAALGMRTGVGSGVSAELVGHGVRGGAPSEVLVGGWGRAAKGLHLRGGVGTALGRGIGTPQLRAMFALSFEPTYEPDRDRDGLSDYDDTCPGTAEDPDGVADSDGCPEPTKLTLAIVDPAGKPVEGATWRFEPSGLEGASGDPAELFGGRFTLRVTAPGFADWSGEVQVEDVESQTLDVALALPMARFLVEVRATGGGALEGATWTLRPAADTPLPEGLAIADRPVDGETIELPPLSFELAVQAPGHQAETLAVTTVAGETTEVLLELEPVPAEPGRVPLSRPITFVDGEASLTPDARTLLQELAAHLAEHPELARIRIEVHTEAAGKPGQLLSEQRSRAIRAYLTTQGVDPDRLEPVGRGGDGADRVELVVERAD